MIPGYRCLSGVLCVALFLSATGCMTSREQADSETRYLYPGMLMDEVAAQLGPPAQIIQGDPGSETVWIYRYEGGPTAAATVFLVIFFMAIVVLAVAGRGGGSIGGGWGGGGGEGPPCQIRLRFGGDGRLLDVSQPQAVPEP